MTTPRETARKRLPGAVLLIAGVALVVQVGGAVRIHMQEVRDFLARESYKTVTAGEDLYDQFDDTTVIGVSIDGHARAYPLFLPKHVTNDTLAEVPIAVSY
jgi:hypothetical protein